MDRPDIFNMCINNLGQKLIFDSDGSLVGFISPFSFDGDYYHKCNFPDSSTDLLIQ